MNTHNGIAIVKESDEAGDIGGVEEVAVDEHGPALESGEVRSQESGEGEFGTLRWVAITAVKTSGTEIGLFDG